MAFSKASRYDKKAQALHFYFRAFSHPARQRIVRKLCKDGPCKVNDLYKGHPLAKATFSGHLKALTESKLTSPAEEFPFTFYSLNKEELLAAKKIIYDFFESLGL